MAAASQDFLSVSPAPGVPDGDKPGVGGSSRTVSTLLTTPTQQQLYYSSAASSAHGFVSEGSHFDAENRMSHASDVMPCVSEDDGSSIAGSVTDINVRSLESHVAHAILERHGLADGSRSPPLRGAGAARWRSYGSSSTPSTPRVPRPSSRISAGPGRRPDKRADAGAPAVPALPGAPQEVLPATSEVELVDRKGKRANSSPPPRTASEASQLPLAKTRLQMVHDRVRELTGEIAQDSGETISEEESPGRSESRRYATNAPWTFFACGLVPLRCATASRLYRFGLLSVGLALLTGLVFDTVRVRDGPWATHATCLERHCWQQRGLLSMLPLVASVVGTTAFSCLLPQRGDLSGTLSLLTAYMQKHDLRWRLDEWSFSDAWPNALLWVLIVITAVAGTALDSREVADPYAFLYVGVTVLVGFFAATWAHCMLYVCRALSGMIDRFCCELASSTDIAQAMQNWNILQAVMLKASGSIEWSFIAMLLAIAFAVPLLLADVLTLGVRWAAVPPLLPGILIMMLFVRAFLVAAAITDKCARVPALVNSLCFGPGTEQPRQLLIEYISSSDAGFYVCDIRLTMGMALKFMYMWCIVAFGLATNVYTSIGT